MLFLVWHIWSWEQSTAWQEKSAPEIHSGDHDHHSISAAYHNTNQENEHSEHLFC